jgi:hypothetical protein
VLVLDSSQDAPNGIYCWAEAGVADPLRDKNSLLLVAGRAAEMTEKIKDCKGSSAFIIVAVLCAYGDPNLAHGRIYASEHPLTPEVLDRCVIAGGALFNFFFMNSAKQHVSWEKVLAIAKMKRMLNISGFLSDSFPPLIFLSLWI